MTTHKPAPAAAARSKHAASGDRANAIKARIADRALKLRAKGTATEVIADDLVLTRVAVRRLLAEARAAGDARALTDRAAEIVAAERAAAAEAKALRAERNAAAKGERAARAYAREQAARLAAEEAEARAGAALAQAEAEAARVAAERPVVVIVPADSPPSGRAQASGSFIDEVSPWPVGLDADPIELPTRPRPRLPAAEFVVPPGQLDPAQLRPAARVRFVEMLHAEASKYPEFSRAWGHLMHLADLHEHCPTVYPGYRIVTDHLNIHKFSVPLLYSPVGSSGAQCAMEV